MRPRPSGRGRLGAGFALTDRQTWWSGIAGTCESYLIGTECHWPGWRGPVVVLVTRGAEAYLPPVQALNRSRLVSPSIGRMANLEKYKEAARKHELKEQWSKAIEVLVKAVEEFEKN